MGPLGSGDIARQLTGCEAACPIQIPTLEGETPPFPEAIDGFRNDGLIASEEIRVFPNDALTAPINFEWADHGCTWVWTARWRVINGPDVVGVAVPPYHSDPNDLVGFYWPDPGSDSVTWSELMGDTESPPSSSGGFLTGSIRELPAWISPVENGNVLTDIVVDWIYWTPAP